MTGDIRDDWKIQEIERKADRAVGELYKIDNMQSSLDSLAYTVRQISTDIARTCSEFEAYKTEMDRRLEDVEYCQE